MTQAAVLAVNNITPANDSNDNTVSKFSIRDRISNELMFGLCGAIGSGIKELKDHLRDELESIGYTVIDIKISALFDPDTSNLPLSAYKIQTLQERGTKLRNDLGPDHLARLAIQKISQERSIFIEKSQSQPALLNSDSSENKTRERVAYLIDQLKHPKEVELFQSVYPKNFYLLTLMRTERERKASLEESLALVADKNNIDEIIRVDKSEPNKFGQQVEKTAALADYFILNRHNNTDHLRREISRLTNLIHGKNNISPSIHETAMHAAYSASLRSACLSRQVGAAITDKNGLLLSVGKNDVPSYGGGLYTEESSFTELGDNRCKNKGKCFNDFYKSVLGKQIEDVLKKSPVLSGLTNFDPNAIVQDIIKNTKVNDLIEYSRAIHAEMDAITTLARMSGHSTKDTILYCTTYPCHNCARHIVAAGITKVVYIEPYEKSLALKLHDDAITDDEEKNKVVFTPYSGVSPSRYNAFFKMINPRKENGSVIISDVRLSNHIDRQYLDSYHNYEDRISADLGLSQ